jgi:hypothetical protein
MLTLRVKPIPLSWLVALLLVAPVLCGGCGKKAPPVAPRQPAMKAVGDLSAHSQDGLVVLTWHHHPVSSGVTGYVVFRAQHAISTPDCPGCPLLFEKTETIALDPDRYTTRHQLTYSQDVPGGFRYTYKVVPVQSSGAQGPDSNRVVVEVPL